MTVVFREEDVMNEIYIVLAMVIVRLGIPLLLLLILGTWFGRRINELR